VDATHKAKAAHLALRAGAAFAFIYPALNALSDPNSWIGYFLPFILTTAASLGLSDLGALHTFGVIEIIIGLWILSGWRIFWPAAIATTMLIGIVIFNLPQMQIVFRDLSIAAMTLALALMPLPAKTQGVQ
jgi:ABC-type phosphate transport system auxiliary subunit